MEERGRIKKRRKRNVTMYEEKIEVIGRKHRKEEGRKEKKEGEKRNKKEENKYGSEGVTGISYRGGRKEKEREKGVTSGNEGAGEEGMGSKDEWKKLEWVNLTML